MSKRGGTDVSTIALRVICAIALLIILVFVSVVLDASTW